MAIKTATISAQIASVLDVNINPNIPILLISLAKLRNSKIKY